ncbi:MAG: asparagine synthase-related protein [Candidatus Zixiibacteriota bacterium]
MPGIAGIVDLEGKTESKEKLDHMLCLMQHEPWYKVARFYRPPIALGKATPGIIDPHPQPVFNQDQSMCLVMYGEVYDYRCKLAKSLSQTDRVTMDSPPAIILELIEKKGVEIVKDLNGSFILALWNFGKKRLTIANDRFGLRPLYYCWQDNIFIFASEMKSILSNPEVKKEIDLEGMAQFFGLNFIMEDRTLLSQIKTLEPASILTFENKKVNQETYWTLSLQESQKGFNRKEALDRAHFLVKQAVKRQIEDEIPKILSLSGGLDSRTIIGAVAQLGYKIPTFTFGIPECPDQKLAKTIADACGVDNRFFELSPDYLIKWAKKGVWLTEGMSNCVNFHGIEFTPEIRKNAQIVLNGFGGGELFGFLSLPTAKLLFRQNSIHWVDWFFRKTNHPFPLSEQNQLFQKEYHSQIGDSAYQSFIKLINDSPADSPFQKFYHFKFSQQAPKSFLYGLLQDNNLVEYRVPFCDYDLVDFVSTIPPREKVLAVFYRRLLTEKFPPLGAIAYQRTDLPVSSGINRILLRKMKDRLKSKISISKADKLRYSDYDDWMRYDLKDFLISILLNERFLSRGYFNPDYVKQMLEQHLSGRQNLSTRIGALLTFELWHQLFIDRIGKL